MTARLNLAGARFGRLVVLEPAPPKAECKKKRTMWKCQCDCGTVAIVATEQLRSGSTRSCGCLRTELRKARFTRHGLHVTRAYRVWSGIRTRCYNPNDKSFPNYGGRGIKMCERWHDFENFYADMGDPPPGMTLDRIDNDGDYTPENCRWATRKQQNRNTRANRMIEYGGRVQCLADWCDELGLLYYPTLKKLRKGKSFEEIVRDSNAVLAKARGGGAS